VKTLIWALGNLRVSAVGGILVVEAAPHGVPYSTQEDTTDDGHRELRRW